MGKYIIAPPSGSQTNALGAKDRPWEEVHANRYPGLNEYLAESTGYGIVSGCEPSINGLTVTVSAGVIHTADGRRIEVPEQSITLDAADATNPRTDVVYLDTNGTIAKITGELGTAAVAGSDTYTIGTNFVAGDTVAFGGVTFTCTASTQDATNFALGSDIATSATNLATAMNANTTINAIYTASTADAVITITEKTAGVGNTPGAMTVTGTGVMTAGTAVMSTAAASSAPTLTESVIKVGEIAIKAGATSGTLITTYNHYKTATITYRNVETLRQDRTLMPGMVAHTLGYYAANDGGGAVYIVRSKTGSDTDDGGSAIVLDNGTVAELIADGIVNVKQFGAKGDGATDDSKSINAALTFAENSKTNNSSLSFTTGDPSHTVLGINVRIPKGQYNLSSPLIVPDSTTIFGDGIENTFLHFTSTYGLELKGSNYNGGRYFSRGKLKDFAIDMNGNGVGITNTVYQTSSSENNSLQDCTLENILVINATIGILILGGWNNTFSDVRVRFCQIGFISDVNLYNGGDNNNSYYNLAINSCKDCGLYTNDSAGTFINLNVEGINSTLNPYSGSKVTVGDFDLRIERPCGVYATKKATALFIHPWFERIYDIDTDTKASAFWITGTILWNNMIPKSKIKIDRPFFNTDVSRGIHISSSIVFSLESPDGGYADLFYIDFADSYGTYFFNTIKDNDVNIIKSVSKSVLNNFKFTNVRAAGAHALYDNVMNYHTSQHNLSIDAVLNYDNSTNYLTKIFNTLYRKVQNKINDYVYAEINLKSGFLQFPQNSGTVTVPSGATSVVVPFGTYIDDGNPVVYLVAHDTNGATLLTGGYYVTGNGNTENGTVTVHFTNSASADVSLSYFCIR